MATKEIRANLLTNVSVWYQKQYPTDKLGQDINKGITFNDVLFLLNHYEDDIYNKIGVADSIIRERIFQKLSKVARINIDRIYDMWLRK